jgi:hypothetical protein
MVHKGLSTVPMTVAETRIGNHRQYLSAEPSRT